MIKKQLVIGRAISAVDALVMHAPEFANKEIDRALFNEPKMPDLNRLHKDIFRKDLTSAKSDLKHLEYVLYSFH